MFRSWTLALLSTLLLAHQVGLDRAPIAEPGFFLLFFVPLGLLGAQAVKRFDPELGRSWRRFWNLLIALLWFLATGWELWTQLQPIEGQGWALAASWLTVAQPYAVTTSLLFGYLWILDHHQRSLAGVGQVLALSSPLILLPLLLLNPGASLLSTLPLIMMAGVLPLQADPIPSDARAQGLVALLEMLSSQTIAWGLLLATFGLLRELMGGSTVEALFVAFSTGLSAWLGAGLIWGLSDALRRGRGEPWRARLLWLLFGPKVEPRL